MIDVLRCTLRKLKHSIAALLAAFAIAKRAFEQYGVLFAYAVTALASASAQQPGSHVGCHTNFFLSSVLSTLPPIAPATSSKHSADVSAVRKSDTPGTLWPTTAMSSISLSMTASLESLSPRWK
jgi:hypothetical protein